MAVNGRDHLSHLDIWRPVESGLEEFIAEVSLEGDRIFGKTIVGYREEPRIDEEEPQYTSEPLEVSRLRLYKDEGSLRLPLVDLRAVPEARLRFSNARSRLKNNPEERAVGAASPILEPAREKVHEQDTSNEPPSSGRKKRKDYISLGDCLRAIAKKHGIDNQDHLQVPVTMVYAPADPLLAHRGKEVVLLPDPGHKVTLLLIDQAEFCLRGLGRKARELLAPYSPTILGVPFCRLPQDAAPDETSEFFDIFKAKKDTTRTRFLPQYPTLGAITDNDGPIT